MVSGELRGAGRPPLIPMPREYSPLPAVSLAHGAVVTAAGAEDRFAAEDFSAWLRELHVPRAGAAALQVRLLRADTAQAKGALLAGGVQLPSASREEGYVITRTPQGVDVIAESAAGIFYGVQTLKQMVEGTGAKAMLQVATVRDWPAMRYRGLHDDLSRGPVPTLDFQKRQIRTLAAYKVNIYSPYFEHTFEYKSNPLPGAAGVGAMSQQDARELVEYAKPYHVTIVPEQEAFGHLHHVLTFEQYAGLSETPLGAVLAPGQEASLDLIATWFKELTEVFPSKLIHIGADETFDLGKGRTKAAVDQQGLGAVYVDFLSRIHERLAPLNRRLLFWGDVAMNEPEMVKRLPKDMIAVAWTYEPVEGGYRKWLAPFQDAGMETWVASGVNNWNRVYPDNDFALRNIQGFVAEGQNSHSTGVLNTVWNDDGEGLFLEDWYGVLFGAAAGWQPAPSDLEQYQASFGRAFHGDATGAIDQAQREMMAANVALRASKLQVRSDALFWADPWSADGQVMAAALRPQLAEVRLHAEKAMTLIAQARAAGEVRETDALEALELGARRMDFIGQKFETADQIASLYAEALAARGDAQKEKEIDRLLWTISGQNGFCQDLRDGYSATRAGYAAVWLKENRPEWLQNVLARYDLATLLWVKRGNDFEAVQSEWGAKHTLPTAASLGIPAP